ncbi:MAG: macro domain-containing protein [Lachnospiraceae bacterium]|nr:macro domain-containing protein [Lachnospiraceae bacterium]
MSFKIVRNDITKMDTEAIVNTANDHPAVGTGCDSAVYKAAGHDRLLEYRKEKIGFVPEGEAFITPGFNLRSKYIIHAVSPHYVNGEAGEEEKLRSCYRKSLELAKANGIHSVAFPLISTGGFGYPKEEGIRIAVDEINAFLLKNEMQIYLVVFDEKATSLGGKLYPDLEEYIDRHYVEEKAQEEYDHLFSKALMSTQILFGEAESKDEPERDRNRRKKPGIFGAGEARRRVEAPEPIRDDQKYPTVLPQSVAEKKDSVDAFDNSMAAEKADYGDFIEEHESKLAERIRHRSDTFSEYLLYLIREKELTNTEVYKNAIVDKKIFSKIKNNADYHPQKLTALCLCMGAKLNLDESKDLLARAGYALSPCDKTDIIFSYFIENEIYDMIELDIQLEEHGLPCIIT